MFRKELNLYFSYIELYLYYYLIKTFIFSYLFLKNKNINQVCTSNILDYFFQTIINNSKFERIRLISHSKTYKTLT